MPATEELALSRFERRKRAVRETCATIFATLALIIIYLLFPTAIGGMLYWMITDTLVATSPAACFDINPNCEIVDVLHKFSGSNVSCKDVFTYRFKLPTSSVVYFERERIARAEADCAIRDLVSAANASLVVGPIRCFTIKDLYREYADFFSCARVFRRNNGTVKASDCNTVFSPTSDYTVGGPIAIAFFVMIYFCCVCFGDCE